MDCAERMGSLRSLGWGLLADRSSCDASHLRLAQGSPPQNQAFRLGRNLTFRLRRGGRFVRGWQAPITRPEAYAY